MVKKIRWGFIGCGKVVETKSGPAFNSNNSEIYAVMRRNIDKARESAAKLGATKYYDNIDAFLSDDNIDAVYIATPPGLHYEQAKKCCKAGKITYLEKPFARNYEEAKEIVDMYKENNVSLYVAHYRRAIPKFLKVKEIIDSGKIGKICDADFRLNRPYKYDEIHNTWLYNVELSGGGKFYDIAPHSIDIMVFLLGKFEEVYGIATNNCDEYKVEDMVVFSFKTDKGIVGTANFNALALDKKDKMVISGTLGRVEFSMHSDNIITVVTKDGTETIEIPTKPIIQEDMIKEVNESILNNEKFNTCSGEDALETYRIMDLVLDKYYDGRTGNFWKRMI